MPLFTRDYERKTFKLRMIHCDSNAGKLEEETLFEFHYNRGRLVNYVGLLQSLVFANWGLLSAGNKFRRARNRQTHPTKPSSAIQNREKILRSISRAAQTFSISAPGDVIRRLNLNNVEVIIMMMSNVP